MQIKVIKLTTDELMHKACEFTTGRQSGVSLATMYQAEHSPIRTQLFWIEMYDIPSFVAQHFRTHTIGIVPFIKTNREDRGGDVNAGRHTPVNMAMLLNAQSLINMAHRRLCNKAHEETHAVMKAIKDEMMNVDKELALVMTPMCEYRGHRCYEPSSCGRCTHYKN